MAQTIPAGNASATYTIISPDEYVLLANTTRTQTANTAIQATEPGGPTTINIQGVLNDTASGQRAIRAALNNGQILVGASGKVQALNGDAIQAQVFSGGNASVTSTVNLTNLGQILSETTITTITSSGAAPPGAAYALNFNAAVGAANAPSTDFTTGGVITNGSTTNSTASIQSNSGDAIRLGAHQTLVNYGVIRGNGQVNDSSTNNSFSGTSTAQRYDISRGVRINADTATNTKIDNFNLIEGAQHGVDVGNVNATNIQITNELGATIRGLNGSGVGADTVGTSAGTVVVENYGTIIGEYAPKFDRAGLATVDGDGDGVDVDGGATVYNHAGGLIAGSGTNGNLAGQGAGGFDSGGRANRSEGLSLGGGTVVNDGKISGADAGIVVNNDGNTNGSRSGVLSTSIINGAGGEIVGQKSYAIRLENKTGSAATDNDTIVNAGTITGNGTIPSGQVRLQDGTLDTRTVGTLDGTTYTTADAGSSRFIAGDGSAIQTGEGSDSLSNYGTIAGTNGRALNMEGGDDTLNLYTGSTVSGRIDGGAGSDTLNLRLDDRPTTAASGLGSLGANSGATTGSLANVVNVETLAVQGGAWTVQDAQTYGSGVSIASGAALTVGAAGALSGAVANAGTLTYAHTGDLTASDAITGQGSLVQAGTGSLSLTAANGYSGGTTIQSGNLDLGAAGAAGTGAITFAPVGGSATARLTLELNAQPTDATFANTITNFGDGSQLSLAGLTGAMASYNSSTATMTVTGLRTATQQIVSQSFTMANPSSSSFVAEDDGNGGTLVTVCYAGGTRILTARGEVAVERLAVGDLAVTSSGAHRPIRWIGHQTVTTRHHRKPAEVMPVRILAGALGENRPARDLVVSPAHAIGLDVMGEVLIPAIALVNGTSIRQEQVASVTYWHIELDSHDLLLAEGQPAESYLDMGNRAFFADGVVSLGRSPDGDAASRTHADFCRPYHAGGLLVEAVRARIAARAGRLGGQADAFAA